MLNKYDKKNFNKSSQKFKNFVHGKENSYFKNINLPLLENYFFIKFFDNDKYSKIEIFNWPFDDFLIEEKNVLNYLYPLINNQNYQIDNANFSLNYPKINYSEKYEFSIFQLFSNEKLSNLKLLSLNFTGIFVNENFSKNFSNCLQNLVNLKSLEIFLFDNFPIKIGNSLLIKNIFAENVKTKKIENLLNFSIEIDYCKENDFSILIFQVLQIKNLKKIHFLIQNSKFCWDSFIKNHIILFEKNKFLPIVLLKEIYIEFYHNNLNFLKFIIFNLKFYFEKLKIQLIFEEEDEKLKIYEKDEKINEKKGKNKVKSFEKVFIQKNFIRKFKTLKIFHNDDFLVKSNFSENFSNFLNNILTSQDELKKLKLDLSKYERKFLN